MNLFVCLTILKGQSNEIVDLQFYTVPPSNLLYSTWATDQRVKVFSMLAGNSTLSKKKTFPRVSDPRKVDQVDSPEYQTM